MGDAFGNKATGTLPHGVTGFYAAGDSPLAEIDLTSFRRRCFESAQRLKGRVISKDDGRRASQNYYAATIELPDRSAAIVINAFVPIVGFAKANEPIFEFLDLPELAELFVASGEVEVWDRAALERPVTADDMRASAPAELEQVKYWRPRRVGDVIFNSWD
ncbi:MAG TPA: hypothetical protein VGN57_05520 [Pirellulaceae bacterium]|jgi:hypothetical protein|nr:hypothetical protein [Pirellulaceae bacterium]